MCQGDLVVYGVHLGFLKFHCNSKGFWLNLASVRPALIFQRSFSNIHTAFIQLSCPSFILRSCLQRASSVHLQLKRLCYKPSAARRKPSFHPTSFPAFSVPLYMPETHCQTHSVHAAFTQRSRSVHPAFIRSVHSQHASGVHFPAFILQR